MATIGVRYTPSEGDPANGVIGFEDAGLDEVLACTDHLVSACPLTYQPHNAGHTPKHWGRCADRVASVVQPTTTN